MWHVYRGINHTQCEVYYGVSKDPQYRVDGSHCRGGTKTIKHWECDEDDIEWDILVVYDYQEDASVHAHDLEKRRAPNGCAGYFIHQTAGI